ncbi:MAG: hypothetical protein LBF34_02495, partial [Puniceicoccales bacterium]|nr:hypothetical protein [Puniceicoccales bacterium]
GADGSSGRSSGVPSLAASTASGANVSSGRSSGVPSLAASTASGADGSSGRSSGVSSLAASTASGANVSSGRSSGVSSLAASTASGADEKEQIDLSVFFEEYKKIEKEKIRGKWKKMREIQQNLLPRMVLYDALGNGWCGFYSLLALLHAQDDLPVISIAIEEVNKCIGKIGEEISRQGSNNTDEIVTLKAVLSEDRRYHKYVVGDSDFNWDQLCADIADGKVWFDYAFLPFAYEALGVYQFDCVDGNNPRALGEIPDCGGLINYGGNHFMVAIPEDLPSGGKRRGLRCQDFDGRWWFSESGKPAVPEDPSQEESLLFLEAFREEPSVHEEKDSVFEES